MMGLFNSRKNLERWAYVVIEDYTSSTPVNEEILSDATQKYIQKHVKKLYDCIHKVLNATKQATKDKYYKEACFEYGLLVAVKKYANKSQKHGINRAIDDFIIMEDRYHHPNADKMKETIEQKRRNKEEFWEGVATVEMIELFSEDLFKK